MNLDVSEKDNERLDCLWNHYQLSFQLKLPSRHSTNICEKCSVSLNDFFKFQQNAFQTQTRIEQFEEMMNPRVNLSQVTCLKRNKSLPLDQSGIEQAQTIKVEPVDVNFDTIWFEPPDNNFSNSRISFEMKTKDEQMDWSENEDKFFDSKEIHESDSQNQSFGDIWSTDSAKKTRQHLGSFYKPRESSQPAVSILMNQARTKMT